MDQKKIISIGQKVIEIEAAAVNNLFESIDENFSLAVESIYNCSGRVVLTGMGKSGLIARKIVATMNSTGTAAIYLHPTDALHGDLGMVRKEDVVMLISKSGNTEEMNNLLPLLKRLGVKMIGVSSNKNSKLAKEVDIHLYMKIDEEACPLDLAPTASTTATLVLGDAIAVALLERRGFTAQDFAMLHPGGSLGKRLSLKIEENMISGDAMPVVNLSTPLKDAILVITSKRLGMTIVVDENGLLSGIITDGDLRRLLEKTLNIENLSAKDAMTSNPKSITKDVLASFALQTMENFKITSLIVADENKKPIGIIHLHDLINLGLQTR